MRTAELGTLMFFAQREVVLQCYIRYVLAFGANAILDAYFNSDYWCLESCYLRLIAQKRSSGIVRLQLTELNINAPPMGGLLDASRLSCL